MRDKPIYVTQPFMPPIEDYRALLETPWATGILTHNGPLLQRFEAEVCQALGLQSYVAVSSGTVALQMAIKALGVKGKIIVPAFTWIATLSAVEWEGCQPIFCDVDPETLNIDIECLDRILDKDIAAILPVHVFGNPCDVASITELARPHNAKVIYDAAHAVGSTFEGESVLNHGDISAVSTHGTKVLNTAEGGGCVASDPDLVTVLRELRFFGHDEDKTIVRHGFNGKLTELQAALGLTCMPHLPTILDDRKEKCGLYRTYLRDFVGEIEFQKVSSGSNQSYFPVIFRTEAMLEKVEKRLQENNVYPRRYFYPAINDLSIYQQPDVAPVSSSISRRILCLPLYYALTRAQVEDISEIIISALKS